MVSLTEEAQKSNNIQPYYKVLLGAILLVIIWYVVSLLGQKWTLYVCDSSVKEKDCTKNALVIEGYKSSRECLEKGKELAGDKHFYCGRGCKVESSYPGIETKVCRTICNSQGCRE